MSDLAEALALGKTPEGHARFANPDPAGGDTGTLNPVEAGVQALDDIGNALRFVRDHSKTVRFCPEVGWVVWDGKRFVRDRAGRTMELAKETARNIYTEATAIPDTDRQREVAKWAMRTASKKALTSILDLAKSDPALVVEVEDLDSDPYLLNVANGTIDLRTGKLKPHDPGDLITKLAPVEYDENAKAPKWMEFLETIFRSDAELIAWYQQWVGYCLTGDVSEQCLAFLYGDGANGKSVVSEVQMRLMGDYALRCPASLITGKVGSIPNDVAQLPGVRLAVASELPEGQRFNEAVVKDLTGNDTLTARFMRSEFFQFRPTHKLVIFGNHKPYVTGVDNGIWRRLRLVPFRVTIPEGDRDPKLVEKLMTEAPGILKWAVEGCINWQHGGLQTPTVVREATEDYRSEMNHVGQFVSENYNDLPGAKLPKKDLYVEHRDWCDENGYAPCGQAKLTERLRSMGWVDRRTNKGMVWLDKAKKEPS